MQYKGKNEILIWAVLREPIVKFHNFASLGGYFLLFEPQKTKKIQKKFICQFLILANFSYIVNRPNFMLFYPNDPQNCPPTWLSGCQKLHMNLPNPKICLETTQLKYRPQAWSMCELADLANGPYTASPLSMRFLLSWKIRAKVNFCLKKIRIHFLGRFLNCCKFSTNFLDKHYFRAHVK